jgi:hypothetical protein
MTPTRAAGRVGRAGWSGRLPARRPAIETRGSGGVWGRRPAAGGRPACVPMWTPVHSRYAGRHGVNGDRWTGMAGRGDRAPAGPVARTPGVGRQPGEPGRPGGRLGQVRVGSRRHSGRHPQESATSAGDRSPTGPDYRSEAGWDGRGTSRVSQVRMTRCHGYVCRPVRPGPSFLILWRDNHM